MANKFLKSQEPAGGSSCVNTGPALQAAAVLVAAVPFVLSPL